MQRSTIQPVLPKTYSYPGGTIHLAPWAWWLFGLTCVLLINFVGGPRAFKSGIQFLILVALFVIVPFFLGVSWEWNFRNQPGRIIVDKTGLTCILPWDRQRYFKWEDIREVRCIARRLHRDFSFWEVQGLTLKDRILITWELKDYKDLLRTIKEHATHCQRFDEIQ